MTSSSVKASLSFGFITLIALVLWSATDTSADLSNRSLQSYQTNSARMQLNVKLCKGLNRASLVSSDEQALNQQYLADLQGQIPIDGNKFIDNGLNDQSTVITTLQTHQTALGMFVGAFFIGILLFWCSCPCVMCCCCCPGCCPSKCCQKEEDEPYSKCELYWPVVALFCALGLAIAASAYGFTKATNLGTSISSFACAVSIIPDDMVNGNLTNAGTSYFSGLSTLTTQLGYFAGNITTITNSVQNLMDNSSNTAMSNTITLGNTALNAIKLISDGSTGAAMPAINYAAPISQASLFPTALGTYTSGGALQTYYDAIELVLKGLVDVSNNAKQFSGQTATIGSSITTAQNTISPVLSQFTTIDTNYAASLDLLGTVTSTSSSATQLFYGVTIGLCSIATLGLLLMTCCNKYKCRYLMYFSCMLMTFICFFGFFLSGIFSIFIPPVSWGCSYIKYALISLPNFNYNFRSLDSSTLNMIGVCMPFGTGDIVTYLGGASLGSLNNLTTVFSSINTFNATSIVSQMNTGATNFQNWINNYGMSKTPDVSTYTYLQSIANPSTYSSCQTALPTTFGQDSFIPSNSQSPSYVSCGVSASAGTCANSAQITGRTASCLGCLDIPTVFSGLAQATVLSNLQTRYANAGCGTFSTDLSNLWGSYYKIKETQIGNSLNAGNGVYARAASASSGALTNFGNSITTSIAPIFTSAQSGVSSISALMNPTYGMLGGINCKVFGEDFQRVIDTLCVNLFNVFWVTRLAMGLMSYGLLFSMCCIVCSGVRHMKHNDRTEKVKDTFNKADIQNQTKDNIYNQTKDNLFSHKKPDLYTRY